MRRLSTASLMTALGIAGCWGAGDHPPPEPATTDSAAAALTRALRFEGGRRFEDDLPAATANDMQLFAATTALAIEAGGTGVLAFDIQVPADATVDDLLLQVQYADAHLEVPLSASPTLGYQHFSSMFTLDDGVCERLCDEVYPLSLMQAVRLSDGRVTATAARRFDLDCRATGDAVFCPDAGSPDSSAAGVGGSAVAGAGGVAGTGTAGIGVGGRSGGAGTPVPPPPPGDPPRAPDAGAAMPGLFACADGTQVPAVLCDGVKDCPDGSDEANCFRE